MEQSAIIITIPQKFLKWYGNRQFLRVVQEMKKPDSNTVWHHGLPSMPKNEITHCYICCGGRVRWKANIAGIHNGMRVFTDHVNDTTRYGGAGPYIELCGPLTEAPNKVPMKGFQGFRYTEPLF